MNDLDAQLRQYFDQLAEQVPLDAPIAEPRKGGRPLLLRSVVPLLALALIGVPVTVILTGGSTTYLSCSTHQLRATLPHIVRDSLSSPQPVGQHPVGQRASATIQAGYYPSATGTLLVVNLLNASGRACTVAVAPTVRVRIAEGDGLRSVVAVPMPDDAILQPGSSTPRPPTLLMPRQSGLLPVFIGARTGSCASSPADTAVRLTMRFPSARASTEIQPSLRSGQSCLMRVSGTVTNATGESIGLPVLPNKVGHTATD